MSDITFNETPCPHCGPEVVDQGFGYCHRPGCPTLTEPHAIVRELAERGPFLDVDVYGDVGGDSCADCRVDEILKGPLTDPANHEPSCLWRRAKALYP